MHGKLRLVRSLGIPLGFAALAAACGTTRSGPEPAGQSEHELSSEVGSARRNFFEGAARAAAFRELERLRAIQQRHWPEIRQLARVTGMGITLDRAQGKLAFSVSVSPGPGAMPSIGTIEGVPVETRVLPPPELTNGGAACVPCHDDLQALPVEMGNSGASEARTAPNGCITSACTIGFKACDLWSEDIVFVTASHCVTATNSICAGMAGFGAPVYHRASLDANSCTPELDIGGVEGEVPPTCGAQNTVDATSVESDASETSLVIRDIGSPSAVPGAALPGDAVQKSGRTTGQTLGIVNSVAFSFSITAASYCCSGATDFDDQILVEPDPAGTDFALGGDSGAALLDQGSPPAVVGMLFAGDTNGWGYANTIGNLSYWLNLSMNHLDCMEPCSATLAARVMKNPRPTLRGIADCRDKVLSQSERGRAYTDTYYRYTAKLVGMMTERPLLFARTVALLDDVLPLIASVTSGEAISVERARIRRVQELFADYASAAPDTAMRGALLGIRADLGNPAILAEFGVTLR